MNDAVTHQVGRPAPNGSAHPITVFEARRIVTMNPTQPVATHVAVRDGRILAVGDLETVSAWGPFTLDRRHAGHVLLPGFVEAHSHLLAGGLWQFPFVGFHARTDPDGRRWEGCRRLDEVVARLAEVAEIAAAAGELDAPLIAWGFDPIFFGRERMTTAHLDRVSRTRPVIILHASQHLMNVNTPALAKAGITRDTPVEGVVRLPDGEPSGELQEFAAMFPILRLTGQQLLTAGHSAQGLQYFGRIAQLAGVTTATDLVNDLADDNVAALAAATSAPDYPVRLVPAYLSLDGALTPEQATERVRARRELNSDKLHYGAVKIVVDGSIQGFTARLRWPGYFNGAPNGIWQLPPESLRQAILHFHAQHLQLHIHVNGDEATDLALDILEEALSSHPWPGHRHTLHHCQVADEAQFRRIARLGLNVNLFVNHVYYWGDAHREHTLGPDRAERLDACATALRHGIPLAIHSDAPITPLAPLFTAWCAANRLTAAGRVLGATERIPVEQALHAITLGAAYTLKLDHLIGSIEVGKYADFVALAEDPLAAPVQALKDVPVLGTVLGGRPLALPGR